MPQHLPVSVPTMTIRAPRPLVASVRIPVSLAIVLTLFPLFSAFPMSDTRVSAGCETTAQITPARYPEVNVIPSWVGLE